MLRHLTFLQDHLRNDAETITVRSRLHEFVLSSQLPNSQEPYKVSVLLQWSGRTALEKFDLRKTAEFIHVSQKENNVGLISKHEYCNYTIIAITLNIVLRHCIAVNTVVSEIEEIYV